MRKLGYPEEEVQPCHPGSYISCVWPQTEARRLPRGVGGEAPSDTGCVPARNVRHWELATDSQVSYPWDKNALGSFSASQRRGELDTWLPFASG